MVGFESHNVLINAGDRPWTRDGGMLSILILGQFKALPRGKAIVPFKPGDEAELGPKATPDYFGPVPPDRCGIEDNCLWLVCDARFRAKVGVSPARTIGRLGSYDPDAGVLTVTTFNLPADAASRPYVNSLWRKQEHPFTGDAVNSYNSPPPEDGVWEAFYELETSSPAAELAPGESIAHDHRTFHFAGDPSALRELSNGVLGVDIDRM